MDIYVCKKCGRRLLTCDLVRSKCSEDFCGSYLLNFCPDCFETIEKEEAIKTNDITNSDYHVDD